MKFIGSGNSKKIPPLFVDPGMKGFDLDAAKFVLNQYEIFKFYS